jgi:hypothetical protein
MRHASNNAKIRLHAREKKEFALLLHIAAVSLSQKRNVPLQQIQKHAAKLNTQPARRDALLLPAAIL